MSVGSRGLVKRFLPKDDLIDYGFDVDHKAKEGASNAVHPSKEVHEIVCPLRFPLRTKRWENVSCGIVRIPIQRSGSLRSHPRHTPEMEQTPETKATLCPVQLVLES